MALKMTYFGSAALVLLVLAGWKLMARGAYESAEYTVIESDGDFEIREYPELTVVTTSMQFERQGKDGSFMRLFRYISGANEEEEKVAMTTPVFMRQPTDKTAGRMAFVLPKKVAAVGAPMPSSDRVTIQKRAGGEFAVIRFSGRINRKTFDQAEQQLREWMSQRGLTAISSPEVAGYDPPWTPGPLRRNELFLSFSDSRGGG